MIINGNCRRAWKIDAVSQLLLTSLVIININDLGKSWKMRIKVPERSWITTFQWHSMDYRRPGRIAILPSPKVVRWLLPPYYPHFCRPSWLLPGAMSPFCPLATPLPHSVFCAHPLQPLLHHCHIQCSVPTPCYTTATFSVLCTALAALATPLPQSVLPPCYSTATFSVLCPPWITNSLLFCVQNGETALHVAALCHKSKVARLLVNAGCSCKLKNKVMVTT